MRSVMKRADRNMISNGVDAALQARPLRRRWSNDVKAQIVAECYAPGAMASEVARRHEISPQLMSAWREAARRGLLKLPDGTEPMGRRPAGTAAIQDRTSSSGEASSALGGPGPGHEFVQTGGRPQIDIEKTIRGRGADERRAVRQERSKPVVLALKAWFELQLTRVSGKATIAEHIRYALNHWDGLTRFLDDGRIELDTNIVERSIRPLVLNRKNALFAGHDQGAENWACIASLIETCKLCGVEPQTYLTDVPNLVVGFL